jgi:hypothetical protein
MSESRYNSEVTNRSTDFRFQAQSGRGVPYAWRARPSQLMCYDAVAQPVLRRAGCVS